MRDVNNCIVDNDAYIDFLLQAHKICYFLHCTCQEPLTKGCFTISIMMVIVIVLNLILGACTFISLCCQHFGGHMSRCP